MSSIYFKNASIVNEGRILSRNVLIAGETIKSIDSQVKEQLASDTKVINAEGLFLLPGVIDDQVHFREPGLTQKGSILSESRAAAAGGITSFMDMPNTVPNTVTLEALNNKYDLGAANSLINYSFYMGATNDNIDELSKVDARTVCGIKVFMGASTGNMLVDNADGLSEIFKIPAVPIACHCEHEPTIRKNIELFRKKYGENIPVNIHPLIRSREACFLSSSFAVGLAYKHNTRLHILHLSTADEMKLLQNDRPLREKKITGEVCVHHLWFDDSYYDILGMLIKWNPAIKTRYDRDELLHAVIEDKIDVVATDHSPHTLQEKANSYFNAPSGGPLVQHSLVAMLELFHKKLITIEKIVEMMCHNPAILFNISDRGFIKEGFKADLCLIDLNNSWTVNKENILYKCGWSPFEGTTFRSKVISTIVNGNIVYDNGFVNENYRGQRLMFNR
jgi:dihydroorotase